MRSVKIPVASQARSTQQYKNVQRKTLVCNGTLYFNQQCTKNRVVCLGGKRGAYRILVGRPDGRRPLGRSRRRWENNIKIGLQEVGWGIDWIELAQDRDRWRALANAVMTLRVP
jgi:hypothetical protein